MLENIDISIDRKCVENYLLCRNFRPFIIPLVIASFLIAGRLLGTFDSLMFDLTQLNKYISALFVCMTAIYLFTLLQAKMLKYEIKDGALYMESGVFYQTTVSIPFEQITDVEVYSGILEKMLGMELIRVQSAGRGSSLPEIIIIAPNKPKEITSSLMRKQVPVHA